ncbi:alpha-E domain-containing protein [Chlorobium sp. N1]|uniref:alpha-E domain-containing protein n=1 Tax=Chlorobium sp. N1 TaxID=2491138 RepID=UPI0010404145|nr:alpha-E domain-containing protein [Chlorobium sp. N1]TCD48572.1 alpha-E domain-containing protein [Chlorobium sp. N1]
MLSRVAESLFWMSRYVERAENTARFLDVNFNLLLDLNRITTVESPECWIALILVTSDRERFESAYGDYGAEPVTDYLVFNRQNPNSIISCIGMARENARSVIESISSEMWEQINNLYHYLQSATPQSVQNDPFSFYREIKNASHLFQGITDSTFPRSEGWDFMQVAKYLERADNTARLVDVKYHMLETTRQEHEEVVSRSVDIIEWMAVLKSCSALEAFRKRYLARIEPRSIMEFLILDRSFPRSINFSVCAAKEALWRLSGGSGGRSLNSADRLIGKMEAELSFTTMDDISDTGLHHYLERLERGIREVGEEAHLTYFASHTPEIEPFPDKDRNLPATRRKAEWREAQQQQQQAYCP